MNHEESLMEEGNKMQIKYYTEKSENNITPKKKKKNNGKENEDVVRFEDAIETKGKKLHSTVASNEWGNIFA